ncbi:protein of unknown function [Propionibacterium cyclohexanicum]|uniref:DUF4395 domain-containing protein n=1 Tax=Propionibacterium cyclohexanicum TaxID=64702 RepID=A0A1H9RNI3_9ACTN|nr:DUF4395 domain-containing protein [Propionibacterium cyclohexanicum]SER74264.1 protein of unknown function [Propionibacterium cyclohexanicum]
MSNPPAVHGEVVDPRGPRFAAGVTSVVLIVALAAGPRWGLLPLLIQLLAFAAGSLLGLRYQPYGLFFRKAIRPRLSQPAELEDARPPRFAQTVGLVFAVAGVLGSLFALPALFYVAVGFALLAALLNAIFAFCLGCEMYLLGKRLFDRPARPGVAG